MKSRKQSADIRIKYFKLLSNNYIICNINDYGNSKLINILQEI